MASAVIYTCIIGDYDTLRQPKVIDPDFDYICVLKNVKECGMDPGIWRLKELPICLEDDSLASRWVKMFPHILFPDYDYSFYLDGNITIESADLYSILRDKIDKGVCYSGVQHLNRNCAYDEALACYLLCLAPLRSIIKMSFQLHVKKMPFGYGMYENNAILRKHNDRKIIQFDEMWWKYVHGVVARDQLSNSLCLWLVSIPFDYLLPEGFSTRNHPFFRCYPHSFHRLHRKEIKGISGKIKLWAVEIMIYGPIRFLTMHNVL